MSKAWRTILWFAFLGLIIAAVLFGVSEMDPALGSFLAIVVGVATLLLCPGSLLFVMAIDIEPGTRGAVVMWLIIALINCAVYAVIGAAYVGLRKKRERAASG